MASFCEKFHVSPDEYRHKLTVPMIALMSLDAPRIKHKPSQGGKNNSAGFGDHSSSKGSNLRRTRISSVNDVIGLISKKQ